MSELHAYKLAFSENKDAPSLLSDLRNVETLAKIHGVLKGV